MIKDGNYCYLDFEKHKEKLIDVFVEYYGKQHEPTIRKRFDTIKYVPYANLDYIHKYFIELLDLHKDELYEEFCKVTGRKDLTLKMKNIIWGKDKKSLLLKSILEGENLDKKDYLFEEQVQIQHLRNKVIKSTFNLSGENVYKQIVKEARSLLKAIENVAKNHSDHVIFRDYLIETKNINSKFSEYLRQCSPFFLELGIISEKDIKTLSKPDFDMIDRENLDCKYLLFGNSFNNPGTIKYFNLEGENLKSTNRALNGIVQYYVVILGSDILEKVTLEEVFNKKPIENEEEYYKKIKKEHDRLSKLYPSLYVDDSLSLFFETGRNNCIQDSYNDCEFMKHFKDINFLGNHFYLNDRYHWQNGAAFLNKNPQTPINCIRFDEALYEDCTIEQLQANLMHEINHAISHGEGIVNERTVISQVGLIQSLHALNNDGLMGKKLLDNDFMVNIEENFNERMAKELSEIYTKKYGNIFEPDDIDLVTKKSGFEVDYDYYSFMTDKLWNKYKTQIKDYRVTENQTVFYDHDVTSYNLIFKNLKRVVEYKILKNFNPKVLMERGILKYDSLYKLSLLIEDYLHQVAATLYSRGIHPSEIVEDFTKIRGITTDMVKQLEKYRNEANKIFYEMEREKDQISRRRQLIDNLENTANKVKGKTKEKAKTFKNFTFDILGLEQTEVEEKPDSVYEGVMKNIKKKSVRKTDTVDDENFMDK